MGTKETNLEKFKKLWIIFEKEIKISTRLETNDLKGFAKYYEKHSDTNEENDKKRVLDKLEKWHKRIIIQKQKSIREVTFLQLQEYCKFLNNGYFIQELLEDETPEHWFD
ncbi:hypothetical protein [Arcobacter defluvii]|jgi:hypothetical protein|uniref:Uncharacterized protein n=1 Tax=Arcobacter defluvii TaxID=873191 RepID=A0AAE7BGI6_9BACT|nr:hypothetical protein [Arcobacter defluvii]QKF77521.1 hypothetical protein ADFLV_1497 [Arcobacter defluvii]RXI31676.1 hypothetical protein CP964_09465 [Arcobacter defluvii]